MQNDTYRTYEVVLDDGDTKACLRSPLCYEHMTSPIPGLSDLSICSGYCEVFSGSYLATQLLLTLSVNKLWMPTYRANDEL